MCTGYMFEEWLGEWIFYKEVLCSQIIRLKSGFLCSGSGFVERLCGLSVYVCRVIRFMFVQRPYVLYMYTGHTFKVYVCRVVVCAEYVFVESLRVYVYREVMCAHGICLQSGCVRSGHMFVERFCVLTVYVCRVVVCAQGICL